MMSVPARDQTQTLDTPQQHLHETMIYSLKATASDITYGAATTGILVFELPDACLIESIGYKCLTAWDADPIVQIGTSTDADRFCTLTIAELGSTEKSGLIAVGEEVLGTEYGGYVSSTGFNIWVTFDQNSASAGAMDLWLYYRPTMKQSAALR